MFNFNFVRTREKSLLFKNVLITIVFRYVRDENWKFCFRDEEEDSRFWDYVRVNENQLCNNNTFLTLMKIIKTQKN